VAFADREGLGVQDEGDIPVPGFDESNGLHVQMVLVVEGCWAATIEASIILM
jgi:hypothetical protein